MAEISASEPQVLEMGRIVKDMLNPLRKAQCLYESWKRFLISNAHQNVHVHVHVLACLYSMCQLKKSPYSIVHVITQ